jgi:hypothetical protein
MNASKIAPVYRGVNRCQCSAAVAVLTVSDPATPWVSKQTTRARIGGLTSIYDTANVKDIGRVYRLGGTVGTGLRSHRLQQVNGDALSCCALRLCDRLTSAPPVATRMHTI